MRAIAGALLIAFALQAGASRLRVSKGRGDANAGDGSWAHPFASVGQCAAAASPGDVCEVERGVYEEGVVLGTGVEIRGVETGAVMTGVRRVQGPWASAGGGIFETTLNNSFPEQIDQVFVPAGGAAGQTAALETGFEARWPNVQLPDVLNPLVSMAQVGAGSEYGRICSEDLARAGVADWDGALAVLNVAHQYLTWTRLAVNTTHGNGTMCFSYPKNLPGLADWPAKWWGSNRFWLQGARAALDAPNEWHFDAGTRTLSVLLPGGRKPGPGEVGVRVRDMCVDAQASVSGLDLFGCGFAVDCSGCEVRDIEATYPSFSRSIPESYPDNDPRHGSVNQSCVNGRNVTVHNVSVSLSNVGGIGINADGASATELLVERTNWFGTLTFGGVTWSGTNVNVSHSTVRFSGNAAAHGGCTNPAGFCNHSVSYSHVHHGGMVGLDSANLYTGNAQDSGTLWYRNWVHDAREKVARFDDQSNHVTIVQNVLFNGGNPTGDSRRTGLGFTVKGNYNLAVGLTSFNNSVADMNVLGCHGLLKPWAPNRRPPFPHQNNESIIANCAYNTNASMGSCNTSFPDELGGQWRGAVQSAVPLEELLEDASAFNFTPRAGSPLIDAGVVFPPWTDGFVGKAPDAGAYERGGEYWVPGCSARPACFEGEPDIVRRVLSSTDASAEGE